MVSSWGVRVSNSHVNTSNRSHRRISSAGNQRNIDSRRRLIDYFLVVGNSGTTFNIPIIIDQYPLLSRHDVSLPSHIPMFCLPCGVQETVFPEEPRIIVSSLLNQIGQRLYVISLHVYEKIHCSTKYTLKALVLISRHKFFRAFDMLLRYLYRSITHTHNAAIATSFSSKRNDGDDINATDNAVSFEALLVYFTNHVCVPSVKAQQVTMYIDDTTVLLTTRHEFEPPPLELRDSTTLLDVMSAQHICWLLQCLLSEKKILVVSSQLSVLTPAIEMLLNMLFPLLWRHLYLPIVPSHMMKALSQYKHPFICGAAHNNECIEEGFSDVIVVHLDTGDISMGFKSKCTIRCAWKSNQLSHLMKILHRARCVLKQSSSSADLFVVQRHFVLFFADWIRYVASIHRTTTNRTSDSFQAQFVLQAWHTNAVQNFVKYYGTIFPRDRSLLFVYRYYNAKLKKVDGHNTVNTTHDVKSLAVSLSDLKVLYDMGIRRINTHTLNIAEQRIAHRPHKLSDLKLTHKPSIRKPRQRSALPLSKDCVSNSTTNSTTAAIEFCHQLSSIIVTATTQSRLNDDDEIIGENDDDDGDDDDDDDDIDLSRQRMKEGYDADIVECQSIVSSDKVFNDKEMHCESMERSEESMSKHNDVITNAKKHIRALRAWLCDVEKYADVSPFAYALRLACLHSASSDIDMAHIHITPSSLQNLRELQSNTSSYIYSVDPFTDDDDDNNDDDDDDDDESSFLFDDESTSDDGDGGGMNRLRCLNMHVKYGEDIEDKRGVMSVDALKDLESFCASGNDDDDDDEEGCVPMSCIETDGDDVMMTIDNRVIGEDTDTQMLSSSAHDAVDSPVELNELLHSKRERNEFDISAIECEFHQAAKQHRDVYPQQYINADIFNTPNRSIQSKQIRLSWMLHLIHSNT